jgi:hypothetical protein
MTEKAAEPMFSGLFRWNINLSIKAGTNQRRIADAEVFLFRSPLHDVE